MTGKDLRWHLFIEDVCTRDISSLSEVQKNAVLCFWYDAEMNSGGHSGYMDCYPETDPQDLENALLAVGNKDFADNYRKAVEEGAIDGWKDTDDRYFSFSPSLCDHIEDYVERHKDEIFLKTANKNVKSTIIGIAVTVALLALFFAVSLYMKGYDLYLFGVIWQDAGFIWYLIFVMPILLMHVIRGAKNLKRNTGDEGHRTVYPVVFLILFLVSAVFLGGLIAEGISLSRRSVIAEERLDDGRSVLLVEKEEHSTVTEGSSDKVTVYCREGVRLKKIGELDEFSYTNDHMIRDKQYRLEQSGDTVTVYYDYGSLTGGLKWRDEAPEYIVREYNIGK